MFVDGRFSLTIACEEVKDIEWFSKTDPFVRVYRPKDFEQISKRPADIAQEDWLMVHQSEHHLDNLNPVFSRFEIDTATLCWNNLLCPLKLEIWDWDESEKQAAHTRVSGCFFTMAQVVDGQRSFETLDSKGQPAGRFKIVYLAEKPSASIKDFVQMGVTFALSVAIDFSASNGIPKDPASHHFVGAGGPNPYQASMRCLLQHLAQRIPQARIRAYGFGANFGALDPNCFPMSLSPQSQDFASVDELLAAYARAAQSLQPAHFNTLLPVLKQLLADSRALQAAGGERPYHIALVFTDGVDCSAVNLRKELVSGSQLPVSFVFVGIGKRKKTDIKLLDSDHQLLDYEKKTAERDAVQYVEFSPAREQADFIEEAFLELEGQIAQFYRK